MGKLGQAHIWVSQSRMLKLLATDRPRVVNLCRAAQATQGVSAYMGAHTTPDSQSLLGASIHPRRKGVEQLRLLWLQTWETMTP